jgi:hypothetical protein
MDIQPFNPRYATSAAAALKKAIQLNSFLRNQYEPLLKEATRERRL